VVREEAAMRTLGMRHFDVQVLSFALSGLKCNARVGSCD
jgi:preprotein translocase subunit SecA